MFRKLLLVTLLAVVIVMATAPFAQAQYDQVYDQTSVYSVPGRVLQVNYDQGSYTADGQFVYYDQVLAQYYGLDRLRRQDWADAPSSIGGIRPTAGDMVTCEIDAETFGLLAVNSWYRPSRPNLYFVYEPVYYYHSHIIIWPQYYRRHFGGYYHGPRFYGGHHYDGPRYRSRDGRDHQPRFDASPPRYRSPGDRGDRPRQYVPRNPPPRRSPGEYQRPSGRDQFRPTPVPRYRSPENPGVRPRPGFTPGPPQNRPPVQNQPPRQYQPPRQQEQRPRPAEPPTQYQPPQQHQQRPSPVERQRGSDNRPGRSSEARPQPRR